MNNYLIFIVKDEVEHRIPPRLGEPEHDPGTSLSEYPRQGGPGKEGLGSDIRDLRTLSGHRLRQKGLHFLPFPKEKVYLRQREERVLQSQTAIEIEIVLLYK